MYQHSPRPIPVHSPNEDYDTSHSIESCLNSLKTLLVSFDAICDSLLETTASHSHRLDMLADRCERSRRVISHMKSCSEENKDGDETPPSVTLTSPTHYRTVLERNANCGGETGGSGSGSATHAGSSLHHHHLNEHDSRVMEALEMATQTSTAASRARDKSNAAIARHLETESNTESHDPRIADSWVDRRNDDCSGDMDEHSVARLAVGMHVAPSLIHNVCHEHAIESGDGDDTTRGGTTATTKAMSAEVAMLIEEHAAHNVLQWDDTSPNHDFRYQSDAAAHHSSIGAYDEPNDSKDTVIMLLDTDGTKPNASRSQTTQQTSYFASSSTDTSMMSNDSRERHSHSHSQTPQPRFVQAASASQPFLCDLLHDSHGVGIDPSGSSPAFSASSCAELLVFNSNTSVYGRHREVPEFDTEAVRIAFADVTLRPKNSSLVINEDERDGVSAADVIDLRTQLPTIRFTDDEGSSTDNHTSRKEQEQQDNGTDELRTDEFSGHETNNDSSGNDDDSRISPFRNKTVNLNFYEPIPDDSDKLKLPESLPLA